MRKYAHGFDFGVFLRSAFLTLLAILLIVIGYFSTGFFFRTF